MGAARASPATRSRPRSSSPRSPSGIGMAFYVFESRSANQRGEEVCRGRWTHDREAAARERARARQRAPGAARHARPLRHGALRRRVRRLQPDPPRRRVRALGRPARPDPPRPLHDGAASRARRPRRSAAPSTSSGSPCSSAAPPCPRRRSRSARRSPSATDAAPARQRDGTAARQGDHPRRDRRARGLRAAGRRAPRRRACGFVESADDAHAPSGSDPAQGRRELRRDRPAGGVADARRRPRLRLGTVDDPLRAGRSSRRRGLLAHPHTSAGRLPTDAGQRYLVDRLLATPDQTQQPSRRSTSRRSGASSTTRCASRPRRSRRSRTCSRSRRRPRSTPRRSATSRC